MSTAASGLEELHQLHIRLSECNDAMEKGPKAVERQKRVTKKKQVELESGQDLLKTLRMAADEKSLQLKVNESKIDELKVKLNSAVTNREFDIMKSQIDADTMANSVLEDEILECYEKVDVQQAVIAKCDGDCKDSAKRETTIADEFAAAEPGLREEIAKLESAISAAEEQFTGVILGDYQRLVKSKGADSMTSVSGGICDACYRRLLPQSIVELNSGRIVFCKSCGRLLYRQPKSE
jgi:hypothetical protein